MTGISGNKGLRTIDRIVVGLGNPGPEYTHTRHNIGFRALDVFLQCLGIKKNFEPAKKSRIQVIDLENRHVVLLLRPTTYMNLSGHAVKPVLDRTGLETTGLLVIHDEMDIPQGLAKMRFGGGAAGHKGVGHIIEQCGPDFTRIRIGIGSPPPGFDGDGADWVLEKLSPTDSETFENLLPIVADGIKSWVLNGHEKAMTAFNTSVRQLNTSDDTTVDGDLTSDE